MLRLLPVLLLVSCAHPFKFKYPSPERDSEHTSSTKVKKIVIELKDQHLFASGMDSTYVMASLFDGDGNLITDANPDDLTLSTDTDIEAKPFVYKQGVYRAEILPRAKSGSIHMKVDWRERVASSEFVLQGTLHPMKEAMAPLIHHHVETRTIGEVEVQRGSESPQLSSEGFSFSNVSQDKMTRLYSFEYPEQARQNISFTVEDAYESEDGSNYNSLFMLFPRRFLPRVEQLTGTLDVTLATGEKMIFQSDSKEIVGGVFTDGKTLGQFPDLKYVGKGILLRANSLDESPEIAQEDIPQVLITNGMTGQKCTRPKTDFWEQVDVTPNEFKFSTDSEFETYLKMNCGFGLPKF
jgi:hypothetical protein